MLKTLTRISCVAAMLATPVFAEDTTAEGVVSDEKLAEDVLDMGQPVAEEGPALGQRYLKEEYGDWSLICIKSQAESDPCNLFQVLKDSSGGAVAEVSLFRIEQAGSQAVAGATIVAPLETLLTAGVSLSVDGAPGKRYNFSFCNQAGCVAQIGLTDGDIAAFKQGTEAKLSVRPHQAPNQVVEVTMSLKGFTAGFDVVDVVQQ